MQKKFNLGKWLAVIYVVMVVVILFRWETNISPILDGGGLFPDSRDYLEVFLLMTPLIPTILVALMSNLFPTFLPSLYNSQSETNQEVVFTPFTITLVLLNTITWYFIGVWIQWTWTTLWKYKDRKKTKLQLTKLQFAFFVISALMLIAALLLSVGALLLTLISLI